MSMVAAVISEHFASIVGPENVVTDTDQLGAYRLGGKTPKVGVRPGSGREVAEIVRFATSEKLSLVPTGARTKLGMNTPVREYDLALDVTRLDRVVSYDAADLTLRVEAGLPLSKLTGVLAEHRQFLPLAVPFENRATVGGTIASGVDSPLRQLYGTARDYVLGMEIVTGDGQLVKSGGRVVKNVSGYDLHKLLIGSFGSLGVITRVSFRTFPAPVSTRALVASFGSASGAVETRHRIAQSSLRPLTLEILSPSAVQLLFANELPPLANANWAVVVAFAGAEALVARYEHDLRQIVDRGETILLDEAAAHVALKRVREFVSIALASSPATAIIKMSVLPRQIPQALDDATRSAKAEGLRWAAMARGVGVIYFALLPVARDEEARSRTDKVVDEVFRVTQGCGGNFTAPWYPAEWRKDMTTRKTNRSDLEQMRKIKHAFDPNGVFSPDPLAAWT